MPAAGDVEERGQGGVATETAESVAEFGEPGGNKLGSRGAGGGGEGPQGRELEFASLLDDLFDASVPYMDKYVAAREADKKKKYNPLFGEQKVGRRKPEQEP